MDRFYTIARIKGGMKFTCTHCAHHVSTLDFDLRDGISDFLFQRIRGMHDDRSRHGLQQWTDRLLN